MNRNHNITFIEDLPNLDEIEQKDMIYNQPMDEKFQKYIRNNSKPDPNSGMYNVQRPMGRGVPVNMGQYRQDEAQQRPEYIQQEPQYYDGEKNYINCIDIVRHVQNCPICSKFYNNDRSIYIILIIVLCVICLLLLKKILDI